MNVTTEQTSKSTVVLTIELTPDDMRPFLEKAAARISARTSIPGFRPGKAPLDVVKKKYGDQALHEEAAQLAIEQTYPQAIMDEKLTTVGQPKIEVRKIAPANPFVYTATVALLPDVTIGQIETFSEKPKDVIVDDVKVTSSIENLRKLRRSEAAVERTSQSGDKVEIDFDIFLDNVPIEGGSNKKYPAVLGEGNLVPAFEENIVGMKAGEDKEFTFTFPKDYFEKRLANREVTAKVHVHTVYELTLPELDDGFAKSLGGFSTMEDVRTTLKENILKEERQKEDQRFEIAVLEELIKRSTFGDIPEILIDAELNTMIYELKSQVEHQGMTFDAYLKSAKKSEQELRDGMKDQALRRIKSALILRAIGEQEHIHASDEDIRKEVTEAKQRLQGDPESQREVDTSAYRDYITTSLTNRRVIAFLTERARGKT